MSVTRSTRKVVPKMAAPTKRVGIGIRAERTRLFVVNAEKQLYYIRQLYSDTSGGNCRIYKAFESLLPDYIGHLSFCCLTT